jgi:hypothetical protein
MGGRVAGQGDLGSEEDRLGSQLGQALLVGGLLAEVLGLRQGPDVRLGDRAAGTHPVPQAGVVRPLAHEPGHRPGPPAAGLVGGHIGIGRRLTAGLSVELRPEALLQVAEVLLRGAHRRRRR